MRSEAWGKAIADKGLLRNCPYALRSDGADVQQQAVILVIVCNDDATFLLHSQHILHIVLDVSTDFVEGGVDVAIGEVDDVEAVLQVADDADYLVVFRRNRQTLWSVYSR